MPGREPRFTWVSSPAPRLRSPASGGSSLLPRRKRGQLTLYRIVFRGGRAPADDPLFEGIVVTQTDGEYEFVVDVVDQAHLQGLLGQIHEHGLQLVAAEPVPVGV